MKCVLVHRVCVVLVHCVLIQSFYDYQVKVVFVDLANDFYKVLVIRLQSFEGDFGFFGYLLYLVEVVIVDQLQILCDECVVDLVLFFQFCFFFVFVGEGEFYLFEVDVMECCCVDMIVYYVC